MTAPVNDKEFASVLNQTPQKRYKYFLSRVTDWGVLWSLKGADGWVVMADDQGREHLPVWPHPRYAEACASADWQGCEPAPIDIWEWLNTWLPGIKKDGRLVAVFPLPTGKGTSISPDELRDHLLAELERIEDIEEVD